MNFAGKIGDRALFLYYIIPGLVKYWDCVRELYFSGNIAAGQSSITKKS